MQLLEFRSSVQKVEYYDCYPINLKYMELLQHAKHDDIKSMETANRQHLKMPNDRYASHSMVLHTREKRLNMHCDRVIISFRSTNCVVPFDVSSICITVCVYVLIGHHRSSSLSPGNKLLLSRAPKIRLKLMNLCMCL